MTELRSIRSMVVDIATRLGGVRPMAEDTVLRDAFERKDYIGFIAEVRALLRLDMNLVFGKVRSGGPDSYVAWIRHPLTTHPYGTSAFRRSRYVLYVREQYLACAHFESLVYAIAHELVHIVLDATGQPRDDERLVDIATMVLGFAEYVERGASYTRPPARPPSSREKLKHRAGRMFGIRSWQYSPDVQPLGYLSREEIAEALAFIQKMRAHT